MRFEIIVHRSTKRTRYSWWLRDDPDKRGVERVMDRSYSRFDSESECRADIAKVMSTSSITPVILIGG